MCPAGRPGTLLSLHWPGDNPMIGQVIGMGETAKSQNGMANGMAGYGHVRAVW